jgi:hypothetical protein
MKSEKRFANRRSGQTAHRSFFPEAYLSFLRVNIDIDSGRIDFNEKAANWISAPHKSRMIAFDQR